MEALDFIRRQQPFNHLDEAALEQVAQSLELAHFPRGSQILSREDPPARYLYLIHKGAVRLEREGQVIQILEEGEPFAFASLLGQHSPSFDVIAEEETEVYQLPAPIFRQLFVYLPFAEFFLKGLSERLHLASSQEISPLVGDMTTPVGALIAGPPVFVNAKASVAEAAQVMRQAGVSSALVASNLPGIVTDRDLRNKVLAEGLAPDTPVQRVMSRPLKTVPSDTLVYEGLLFMLHENIHHLPITRQGQIIGLITDRDVLRHRARSPFYLQKQVEKLAEFDNLSRYALDIAGTVEALFEGGLDIAQIGRIIANLNDALVKKLLHLAEAELGPPPTAYAWIVFGSAGRQEQALLTHQDNALVYLANTAEAKIYFERLAQRVVDGLVQAGFPHDKESHTATQWCFPLAGWEGLFRQWVQTPTEQALLEAAIFFDFRRVHGNLALDSLEEIMLRTGKRGVFLTHLAASALNFKPPLGFFRRIREETGGVNLKTGGIGPIVDLARLYALYVSSPARSTVARLEIAGQKSVLSRETAELLAEAFRFISYLRLREQLRAYRAGKTPTHCVRLESLSSSEQRHLKETFLAIREAQDLTTSHFHTE